MKRVTFLLFKDKNWIGKTKNLRVTWKYIIKCRNSKFDILKLKSILLFEARIQSVSYFFYSLQVTYCSAL